MEFARALTQLETWSFAEHAAERGRPRQEAFDSFGPVSDIRKALNLPGRSNFPQARHDFTRILAAEARRVQPRRVLRRPALLAPHVGDRG